MSKRATSDARASIPLRILSHFLRRHDQVELLGVPDDRKP